MKGDFGRFTFDPSKHYTNVLLQQGRVMSDSDWTEQSLIDSHRDSKLALDTIGADGAPKHDAGFRVEFTPDGNDLVITPGSYYVGGHLCRVESTRVAATRASATSLTLARWHVDGADFVAGQYVEISAPQTTPMIARLTVADPATKKVVFGGNLPPNVQSYQVLRIVTYLSQPHYPNPPYRTVVSGAAQLSLPAGQFLAYLHVFRRDVSAIDDPAIKEIALGGPDTSTRLQAVWQLKIWPPPSAAAATLPSGTSCSSAVPGWEAATARSTGLMNARTEPSPAAQPCVLPPGAGYKGMENQFYRVEIHEPGTLPGGTPTFKWSRDNACVAGPITEQIGSTGLTVPDGPDDVLGINNSDWVEQTDDSYTLNFKPGPMFQFQKDPTTGVVALNYQPDLGLHPQLRRWENKALPLSSGWIMLENDIQIRFEPGTYQTGDTWTLAARTATAEIEWQVDGLGNPVAQPCQSPEHHYCRIGVIVTAGARYVEDCRKVFAPLNELKAVHTCCTYSVGDGVTHVGDFTLIQDAVNALPLEGGQICIFEGEYHENVKIGKSNVHISGCGNRTVVVAAGPEPVFRLAATDGNSISSLSIEASSSAPGILGDAGSHNKRFTVQDLSIRASGHSAIKLRSSEEITIQRCRIVMTEANSGNPGIFLETIDGLVRDNWISGVLKTMSDTEARKLPGSLPVTGVELGGGCERVNVLNNLIEGCTGHGIALGSLVRLSKETVPGQTGQSVVQEDPAHACADCEAPSSMDPPLDDGGDPPSSWLESMGDLYRIRLCHNRIFGVGLNGISAIHFFDLGRSWNTSDLIRVQDLEICNNHIEYCVRREFASVPFQMFDNIAYGAIALSLVEGGLFRDNRIENLGYGGFLPTVGIWVQFGMGLSVLGNRILNCAALQQTQKSTNVFPSSSLVARQGGIHIGQADSLEASVISPMVGSVFGDPGVQAYERLLEEAVVLEGNSIEVGSGQAVWIWAWTSIRVVSNHLASHGIGSRKLLEWSREAARTGPGDPLSRSPLLISLVSYAAANPSADDISWRNGLPGNIIFDENQCIVRCVEGKPATKPGADNPAQPAIVIGSRDAVGCHLNQLDCYVADGVSLLVGVHISASTSVSVTGNRFKETQHHALYSALTDAPMNITAHNQGNHCFLIKGDIRNLVDGPNQVLIDPGGVFCNPELAAFMEAALWQLWQ